jgi:hypothetical protein
VDGAGCSRVVAVQPPSAGASASAAALGQLCCATGNVLMCPSIRWGFAQQLLEAAVAHLGHADAVVVGKCAGMLTELATCMPPPGA